MIAPLRADEFKTIFKKDFNNCSERGQHQESSELKMLNRHVRATKV